MPRSWCSRRCAFRATSSGMPGRSTPSPPISRAGARRCARRAGALTVLFGNVAVDPGRPGEDGRIRKFNAVYVCHDGGYVRRSGLPAELPNGVHPKTLHPNYRFFDDDRHFHSVRKLAMEHGRPVADWMVPFEVPRRGGGAFRFGVQVCEDVWCQDYAAEDGVLDTVAMWRRNGAQAVFQPLRVAVDLGEEREAPSHGTRGPRPIPASVLLRESGRRPRTTARTCWSSTATRPPTRRTER